MRKVLIVPGNGRGGDIRNNLFYGWAERELLKKGNCQVVLPEDGMPDPLKARKDIWLPYILGTMGCDENSILIGHSSGAAAGLKLAESNKLYALVLVAGYDGDLGDEGERESGYFDAPFDYEKIQSNCEHILQFSGAEDFLVSIDVQRRLSQSLLPKVRYIEDAKQDHFFLPPFSRLIEEVDRLLNL